MFIPHFYTSGWKGDLFKLLFELNFLDLLSIVLLLLRAFDSNDELFLIAIFWNIYEI